MRAGVIVGVLVCSVLVGLVESKSAHKYQNHGNRDSPEGGVAAEDHTLKNREEPVTSSNEANLAAGGKPKKHGSNEVIPTKFILSKATRIRLYMFILGFLRIFTFFFNGIKLWVNYYWKWWTK
ncbi:hypothetical protein GE061_009195 [Apolygus lucorum]|uniref:Secreted protein n=1 Tax=Apolygus lucorum TaxID=248454 RepID=A0A6A4K6T2_APOLU|nr:hypothetical protein GE061_009195 [Apolygus lucorum]